ncbi:MAG: hypothetical protein A2475_01230 [Ignavibacteria bacterium RIFOXYC2_FULL_35_21]|nr:MAG: hypothetical protein A2475_01230 [Ignavibacteria bacterium RIFOXYC2_FULL_35_21]
MRTWNPNDKLTQHFNQYDYLIECLNNDELDYKTKQNSLTSKSCIKFIDKFQNYYDEIFEFYYNFSRLDSNQSDETYDGLTLVIRKVSDYKEISRVNSERIQFNYLFPLKLKLSQKNSRNSLIRDIIIFILGAFLGLVISYIIDNKNTIYLKSIFNEILQNERIIMNQVDEEQKFFKDQLLDFKQKYDSLKSIRDFKKKK